MLNSNGLSGFKNAPVTKSFFFICGILSIFLSISNLKLKFLIPTDFYHTIFQQFQFWRLLTSQLFFLNPQEFIFGLILIYQFRIFERQMGSSKFSAFLFSTFIFSILLQIGAYIILPFFMRSNPIAGPYSFIFSCFVQYYFDIPSTYRFRIFGINSNDKLFIYILGIQFLLSNFPSSIILAFSGIISGLTFRSDTLKLNKFKFPNIFINFCKKYILPIVETNSSSNINNNRLNRQFISNNFREIPQYQGINNEIPNVTIPEENLNEESIQTLMNMGFSRERVIDALKKSQNNLHVATNILLDS